MDMLTAAVYRKSVRNFSNKAIEKEAVENIKAFVKYCSMLDENINTSIEIVEKEDMPDKIKSIGGYNGFWIDAPYYIVIFSENKDNFIENAGYIGEDIILHLTSMGIDSCWLTLNQEYVVGGKKENMRAVGLIAIGYGEKYKHTRMFNKMIWGEGYKNLEMQTLVTDNQIRMDIKEMVYDKEYGREIDEDYLLNCGYAEAFYAARLAPSALNRQPWRFILDNDIVLLVIKRDDYTNIYEAKIAAGAVMLNFAAVVSERVKKAKWIIGEPKKEYNVPNDCVIVSYCRI